VVKELEAEAEEAEGELEAGSVVEVSRFKHRSWVTTIYRSGTV